MNQEQIIIEFDGGTSCNIPSQGYGIGYGSFKIGSLPVEKVDHGRPMSNNVAEIMTGVVALDKARSLYGPSDILLRGDSKIALKWLSGTKRNAAFTGKGKKRKQNSSDFVLATEEAKWATAKHRSVKTEWRGREASVELFGH